MMKAMILDEQIFIRQAGRWEAQGILMGTASGAICSLVMYRKLMSVELETQCSYNKSNDDEFKGVESDPSM
jgi:hypothetical protein